MTQNPDLEERANRNLGYICIYLAVELSSKNHVSHSRSLMQNELGAVSYFMIWKDIFSGIKIVFQTNTQALFSPAVAANTKEFQFY